MSQPLFRTSNLGVATVLAASLLTSMLALPMTAQAEKYQSRLNSLLLKKNDVYLPSRLVIGEDAKFVVKAPAGTTVKIFLSSQGEGFVLPNGTPLRVGDGAQEVTGVIPENGILELKAAMPKDPELQGKVIYVDAVAGASDEELAPIDLVDATGRRTMQNTLVLMKPAEIGGPSIMPSMPGVSPQLMNQLSTLGDVYGKQGDGRKQLMDTGEINQDREIDKNPFVRRGIQPGIGY
jgi:hypothetical protein